MSEAASRRRKALRDFYRLQQQQKSKSESESLETEVESDELDLPDDKVDDYVKQLMTKSDIRELLHMENQILNQIKSLDSEQKTLIYNNYDKLISTSAMLDSQMNNAHQLTLMDQLSGNLNKVSELLKSAPEYSQLIGSHTKSKEGDTKKALVIRELRWLFTVEQGIIDSAKKNEATRAHEMALSAIRLIDLWQPKLNSDELSGIRENCHKLIEEYKLEGI